MADNSPKEYSEEGATQDSILYHITCIDHLLRQQTAAEPVKRDALFPILDEEAYRYYCIQENIHWTEFELDFLADKKDYDAASPAIRWMVDVITALFLVAEGGIARNLVFRFLLECATFEEQNMFISQLHIEMVHANTYGMIALAFKGSQEKLSELLTMAEKLPCIQAKQAFMERWSLAARPRRERLVAFAASEGIFFCTLFAVIYWFRPKGIFPNFTHANHLIASDESLHRDFGCFLFRRIVDPLSAEEVAQIRGVALSIIQEAVTIQDSFMDCLLPAPIEDLSAEGMRRYTRVLADNLLYQLGCPPYYGVKCEFSWMGDITMEQKGNFHEVRDGNYKKKSLQELLNWRKRVGLLGEETAESDVYSNPLSVSF